MASSITGGILPPWVIREPALGWWKGFGGRRKTPACRGWAFSRRDVGNEDELLSMCMVKRCEGSGEVGLIGKAQEAVFPTRASFFHLFIQRVFLGCPLCKVVFQALWSQ